MLNAKMLKQDFPIFERKINGQKLIYLDNVATTQRPKQVLEAETDYYSKYNANIHRGAYALSMESSNIYEETKRKAAAFIGAESWEEIIYTRNATEAINIVAGSLTKTKILKKNDTVLSTQMEHHANLVPWIELAKTVGIRNEFTKVTQKGELDLEDFEKKLKKHKPKLVAITHVSNVLGTINPVHEITSLAHKHGALVLIDGAQAVPHLKVNVREIGADFYAFSGHKMLAPFGIGVLYGKKELLEKMEPFLTGGDMISTVTFKQAEWNSVPWKFEAGTQNIGGAVALSAAINYIQKIGQNNIHAHEQELIKLAIEGISKIKGAKIYGPAWEKRAGLVAFNIGKIHPHDIASVLDKRGIQIRSGNHCAQPLMSEMGIIGTCRAGFYIYNTKEDVEELIKGLREAQKIFG